MTTILVGLVLAVTGCGGDDEDSGGAATGPAGSTRCDLAIAFFGAQTGDAANLGINISNGVQLAVNKYNADHPDCPVKLERYDSEGLPDKASSLAQKVVQQENVLGVVGPAFSGESEVANPIFNEAGVPLVSASATRPTLSAKGWRVFHRVLGNDSVQGPAAAKYVQDVVKAEKVFIVDDASVYGKDLATLVRTGLQDRVVGTDTIQQKQTDFSATVTKIKSSGATLVFFGGYYPEAGLLRKQLTDSGGRSITLMGGDGVRDLGYVDSAGAAAAEGTITTCACLPPERAPGSFVADYQAAFGKAPGTYSAEAFDAANVLLDGIAAGRTTRPDMLTWIDAYDKQGITKHLRFDERGEVADTTVWTYRFENGQIVADRAVE